MVAVAGRIARLVTKLYGPDVLEPGLGTSWPTTRRPTSRFTTARSPATAATIVVRSGEPGLLRPQLQDLRIGRLRVSSSHRHLLRRGFRRLGLCLRLRDDARRLRAPGLGHRDIGLRLRDRRFRGLDGGLSGLLRFDRGVVLLPGDFVLGDEGLQPLEILRFASRHGGELNQMRLGRADLVSLQIRQQALGIVAAWPLRLRGP